MSGPKLALAYVHPGMVHERFSRSMHRFTATHPGVPIISCFSGSLLAPARNNTIRAATHLDVDILVWMDTDIVWEPEQVDELVGWLDNDHRIVTGIYMGLEADGDIFPQHVPHDADVQGYGLTQIDGTGMGFCAIDVEIIEPILAEFPYPYAELFTDRYGMVDQDVGFCIRAADLGYDSFVANIPVGHIKEQVI